MVAKEIWVIESEGRGRVGEPITVSVPLARGELPRGGGVQLLDPRGVPCPVQSQVVGRWPDESVKWLLCDFVANVPAASREVYTLIPVSDPAPLPVGIEIGSGKDSWRVDTGGACFLVDTKHLLPFASFGVPGLPWQDGGDGLRLTLLDGQSCPALVEAIGLETRGALRTTLRLTGRFQEPARALFSCRLHFYSGRSCVGIELTLLNPSAAQHPGGLWDLGDPGSMLFRELAWVFPCPEQASPELVLIPEPQSPPISADGSGALSICQVSSGGKMRISPNHRAADGRCYASSHGYLVNRGESLLYEGERATPSLWVGSGEHGVLAVIPRFWQEFPKALSGDARSLKVALFPDGSPAPHELQGGEQKTTLFTVDFVAAPEPEPWLWAPLCALVSPQSCRDAGVLADLPPLSGEGADLVDRFLTSPEELLARREQIDEYGWRNFGEVYADHEAVYHRGERPMVSHYNNQYDLCGGLYRKFLSTGDPRWQELAADLARHVLDIDLYHTKQDREEYNGGLFWHTEHYLPAGLATHRTFSREHLEAREPSHYGGGPAAEHCYTSGLLLHYLLTGNRDFRDAVLDLSDWSYRSLSGGTILGTIKRSFGYVANLRRNCGAPFPRYPLTRGTGNALNAALDAFLVTAAPKYLERAEELFRQAIHPADDIEARHLLEPEAAWSYTVLLAAVAKYLDLKQELEQFDAGYAFARETLLAYASWMVPNEYPYLRRPEKLAYPNETWAAQELRKSAVLHHAARYADGDARACFLAKARELSAAAVADLDRFPTSNCTRPLALMLQNGWVAHALSVGVSAAPPPAPGLGAAGAPTPTLGPLSVSRRILSELGAAIKETNLKREMTWLRARLRSRRGK